MSIILLADQTEVDSFNAFLDAIIPTWAIETFKTPLDIGRPDKPFCMVKHNIDNMFEYLDKSDSLDANLVAFANTLETTVYNKAITADIPINILLSTAPIGQWSFVLEGSSTAAGTFMTHGTKIGQPSNLMPAVLPANLHLVSMTYSNENDNVNDDITIYLNETPILVWELRNTRWGVKNAMSDTAPLLALPERGLVKVEIKNVSAPSSKDGILTLYFRMVGQATGGEYLSPTLY